MASTALLLLGIFLFLILIIPITSALSSVTSTLDFGTGINAIIPFVAIGGIIIIALMNAFKGEGK